MRDHVVMLCPDMADPDSDMLMRVFGGMRNHCMAVDSVADVDSRNWERNVTTWLCEEVDVPHMAEYLTGKFPGRDVSVFKLGQVYFRPPGEIQTKAVTKDGVLPF